MPQFYGYERYILNEIRKKEAKVDVFYTNLMKYDYKYRFLKMVSSNISPEYYVGYFEKQIQEKDYDIIFVIAEASIDKEFIVNVLKRYKKAQSILYLWDSLENCPKVLDYFSFFDNVYTFDYQDSIKKEWKYRPLFYIEDLIKPHNPVFDISIICTAYSERIRFINELQKYAYENKLQIYNYLYSPVSYFVKNRLIKERFGRKGRTKIKFSPISLKKTYEVYSDSFAVIDLASKTQSGLTMRTIECLGNSCKLITNNESVLEADFYDSGNIFYFESNLNDLPVNFFEKKYKKTSTSILKKYSISQWINDLLGEECDN